MVVSKQQRLGKTLWNIANDLRGSMMADDFRDYMLSFLFWKYLSDSYVLAAKKDGLFYIVLILKNLCLKFFRVF